MSPLSHLAAAGAAGLIFGAGLLLSGMVDPVIVIGFLDVAALTEGRWRPELALVMAGALLIAAPAFAWIKRRNQPLLTACLSLPTKTALDRRLILGSAIFGVGWGLGGICPGPALTGLGFGDPTWLLFGGGLLVGVWIAGRIRPAA